MSLQKVTLSLRNTDFVDANNVIIEVSEAIPLQEIIEHLHVAEVLGEEA